MPILVTGDLHLSANSRDRYRWVAMETIASLLIERKITTLVILGDLTQQKNYHGAELVNDIVELFYNLACICRVVVLRGNHDYEDADCPFFLFMRRLPKLTWINRPTAFALDELGQVLFLPHSGDWKRDWQGIEAPASRIIFAHNTFEGAVAEHGTKLSGIPLSALPPQASVLSGDVHMPQMLEAARVTYVGAPYLVNFGDEYQPRVFQLTVDRGVNIMESILIQGPQKRLLKLHSVEDVQSAGVQEGDVIKVEYFVRSDDREKWPQIKAQIRAWLDDNGCQTFAILPVFDAGRVRSIVPAAGAQTKSDDETVRDFVKQVGWGKSVLDAGLTLMRGEHVRQSG